MHYRNGREAKNGDRIIQLSTEGGKVLGTGILYDAVEGNDYCNGSFVPITNPGACLCDCIHADDLADLANLEIYLLWQDRRHPRHLFRHRCRG